MQNQKKLKITNPHHINTKNYQQDGSIVEICYMNYEARINAFDKKVYHVYKFEGHSNKHPYGNVIFEIHTEIRNSGVQFNIWKGGGMEFNSLPVDVIKNRDEFIQRMINEVNKY